MRCTNCGCENKEDARFCAQCGTELPIKLPQIDNGEVKGTAEKSVKRLLILFTIILIIAAVMIALTIALKSQNERRKYQETLDQADNFLEELDYENAEASYLLAIEIEPKQSKPYLKLAEVYLVQEEWDKAEEILQKAIDNGVDEQKESGGAEDEDTTAPSIQEKLEEIRNYVRYSWVVPAEIEADDIYYVKDDNNLRSSVNETNLQKMSEYAVIRRGDLYGLIGMDGEILGEVEYSEIRDFFGIYLLNLTVPKNENGEEYSTYVESNGKLIPLGPTDAHGIDNQYYYYEGIHNLVTEEMVEMFGGVYHNEPETAIPIQQMDQLYIEDVYEEVGTHLCFGRRDLPYGIYTRGKMITDFEYEEIGSCKDDLLAVKKDGKWGYVNMAGEEVFPIEFDESWDQFVTSDGEHEKYCYSAADGFVVLCKDGKWELCSNKGNVVIPFGIFDEIRPVYSGKCWVKKGGKWGIITLNEEKDSLGENANTEGKISLDQYIDSFSDMVTQIGGRSAEETGDHANWMIGDGIQYGNYRESASVDEMTIDSKQYMVFGVFVGQDISEAESALLDSGWEKEESKASWREYKKDRQSISLHINTEAECVEMISFWKVRDIRSSDRNTTQNDIQIEGEWRVDSIKTYEENSISFNDVFGNDAGRYGDGLALGEQGQFKYYIGVGVGGEGTYQRSGNQVIANVTTYEEGNQEEISIHIEDSSDGVYLVQDYNNGLDSTFKIYWIKS